MEDFQTAPEPARNAINGWVAHRTEDQIPTLFPQGSINTLTRLVLANAVYFHGDWKVKFKKDSPNEIFHALTGDVSVPTMHGTSNAAIWSGAGWNAGALDYVGNTTSMIVVVPDAGTFAAFESGLTFESLSAILAGAHPSGGADLIMPRFKFSTDVGLNDTLSALGMPDAFSDAADFSGINGARDLRVQSVIHKAIINVDEIRDDGFRRHRRFGWRDFGAAHAGRRPPVPVLHPPQPDRCDPVPGPGRRPVEVACRKSSMAID